MDITNFLKEGTIDKYFLGCLYNDVKKTIIATDYQYNKVTNLKMYRLFNKNNYDLRLYFKNNLKIIELYFWNNEKYSITKNQLKITGNIQIYNFVNLLEELNLNWNINSSKSLNHVLCLTIKDSNVNVFFDLDSNILIKMIKE